MTPSTIVLLRHGEKKNAYELTPTGRLRTEGLVHQWLGRGAAPSLFDRLGLAAPVAFLTTTLHTIELAAPSAYSWGLPLTSYTAVTGDSTPTKVLGDLTEQAVDDALRTPAWAGGTVVVCWEHHHLADATLNRTWRMLLGLDRLPPQPGIPRVPESWSGSNYDYFWVVPMDQGAGRAAGFTPVLQTFTGKYADVPQNPWGQPEASPG